MSISPTVGISGGASGPVYFPATQVASTDPNVLDDYEEGTWTPTYNLSTTQPDAITYDAVTGGQYVKVGQLVHIQGCIRTDSITAGSAAGTVRIAGLPFTAASSSSGTSNGSSAVAISTLVGFSGDYPSHAVVLAASLLVALQYRTAVNGATTSLDFSDLGTGGDSNQVFVGGSYRANQ